MHAQHVYKECSLIYSVCVYSVCPENETKSNLAAIRSIIIIDLIAAKLLFVSFSGHTLYYTCTPHNFISHIKTIKSNVT